MKCAFNLLVLGLTSPLLADVAMAATVRQGGPDLCQQLAAEGKIPGFQVQQVRHLDGDPKSGAPAHCELTALASSVPTSRIALVYRLPDNWNGRMLGIGGGGWAGNVTLAAATEGLKRGYATAQTDGGHESAASADTSWARANPVAMTDFSHRAVHVMTVHGKNVVEHYYGTAPKHSYFQGCSTGGRMGLMEAQRYPEDYDGVIAGAPVYSLLVQTSSVVRAGIFSAPGAGLNEAQLTAVNKAALAACDADDGLVDGVVTDPRRCKWDPAAMACKPGQHPDGCLTPPQVVAMQRAYQTIRSPDGTVGNFGLTRGGEAGWGRFIASSASVPMNAMNGALGELVPYMFPGKNYDPATFDPVREQPAVHQTPFAKEYEASNPDLGPFLKRGGKLLLWHGFDDPGPSPFATIDYYAAARKANGANADIELYIAPGVYHCRGGPGADVFDLLTPMERWVEHGTRPAGITARNAAKSVERPMCAYPKLPYYAGGDPGLAQSFSCK